MTVEYALNYALVPNIGLEDDFWFFAQDGTNFVSQCWYTGGIKQNSGWHWQNRKHHTKSWTDMKKFVRYMTKYSAYYSDENKPVARICRDKNSVQIGDLIQFRNNADIWYKLAIITEIKYGEIYYVQHSPNCLEHKLSEDNAKEIRFICAKN